MSQPSSTMLDGRDAVLEGKVALVVGASRGLGRGIAESFLDAGAVVIGVARDSAPLRQPAGENSRLQLVSADASDPVVAGTLLGKWRPNVLAIVAGARPWLRPIHLHTWETFSINWQVDVRIAFHWVREALLLPLAPGSRVIVMSSGAAMMGSPLSGGYAGAKATERFIADYAAQEAQRLRLGIGVCAVLPRLTPATELGRAAVDAYAERQGLQRDEYVRRIGEALTPAMAGAAFLELATTLRGEAGSYLLSGSGLQAIAEPR